MQYTYSELHIKCIQINMTIIKNGTKVAIKLGYKFETHLADRIKTTCSVTGHRDYTSKLFTCAFKCLLIVAVVSLRTSTSG